MRKIKLPKPKSIEEIIPFILIIVCVVAVRFIGSEVLVLAVFIATLGIYAWRKYDSRFLVTTALIILITSAAFLVAGSTTTANEAAILAYYFLVTGVTGLLIEYLREENQTSNNQKRNNTRNSTRTKQTLQKIRELKIE